MSNGLSVTTSPHIKAEDNITVMMIDFLIALTPAMIMGVFYFGFRALIITLISIISSVVFEYLYRRLLKKSFSLNDLSAVVTGMLLAFTLPPSVPYWIPVVGAFFAIVIVKQLFGGLGKYFMSPIYSARVFLLSWPLIMTTWSAPFKKIGLFIVNQKDIITEPTPLSILKMHDGTLPDQSIFQMLSGEHSGSIGETCSVLLLLGGIYLLYRKVITWHIPVSFIGTVAILTFVFHWNYDAFTFMSYNILAGGLLLGAIFISTDFSSSPLTRRGKLIFGIGCGAITVFLRNFGAYPEGVFYAVLIMNAFVWLIDKFTRPRRYGTGGGAINV